MQTSPDRASCAERQSDSALRESEKTPVVVKAKDLAGNVGSCQVLCEIKVKEDTVKKNFKVNKKLEQQRKKKAGIEPETTKNKKKSSKKK